MEPELLQSSKAAKRGRFEIRSILLLVLVMIIGGGLWTALNGSSNRGRAAIDSSANPTPTINPQPHAAATAPR